MKKGILVCPKCSTYTLEQNCQKDNTKTISPKPAKFSIEDKYGKWRREYKKNVQD